MHQNINTQIYELGRLNMEIYKCINSEYITDKVIITRKQLFHIRERHPETYNNAVNYIEEILRQPDYIIEDKKPNTGLVIILINVIYCQLH